MTRVGLTRTVCAQNSCEHQHYRNLEFDCDTEKAPEKPDKLPTTYILGYPFLLAKAHLVYQS